MTHGKKIFTRLALRSANLYNLIQTFQGDEKQARELINRESKVFEMFNAQFKALQLSKHSFITLVPPNFPYSYESFD